uniref:Cyanocobalamin reductase (cyanide-eliminating) n=1 Tax=Paramoeba aestuarina TaxID=180227 RepID=A0A7S4L9K5_9EUKA|eukprot:CAMPEP_0201521220 /NCGR_PEP_ID=MMETSP0161_2-20130828/14289_1 /ASSEMBLY_ACC=CAM_ASM_000251 /TAXON_ID=180227 /ORGANISM="Neoparamoeba aestuarina, Strain SoJaBio B1-5/56/2" /LENGTH=260 /DNA_ID=CAMNT_0047919811 /DNA_START=52 /DNA_END=834 /DNA_ORIENTATION=+
MAFPNIESSLRQGCNEFGLDIFVKLKCGWYSQVSPPTAPLLIDEKRVDDQVVGFLLGGTKTLWVSFLKAYSADLSSSSSSPLYQEGDPLDTYVRKNIESLLENITSSLSLSFHIFYSWEVNYPKLLSFGRLASSSCSFFFEENTHLACHPTYGPWVSLKAFIVFPSLSESLSRPPPPACPLSSQSLEEAKQSFQEALSAPEDTEKWKLWVKVRDCVAGGPHHPFRYSEDEIAYYYGKRDFQERHRFLQNIVQKKSDGDCK